MQIDWWTLAIQAANFLVLVWLLTRVLYRPVKDVIAKRQEMSEQAFDDAREKAEAAEQERAKLESDRSDLAEERQELLAQLHKQMQEEKKDLLEEAQKKSDEMLENARKSIAAEREKTLVGMEKEIIDLAAGLCEKIFAETGPATRTAGLLDNVSDYFKALSPDTLDALKADVAEAKSPVEVFTASALSAVEKKSWKEALTRVLGRDARTSFAVDPHILGGARIRFPHSVLDFSWAELLRQASSHLLDKTDDD